MLAEGSLIIIAAYCPPNNDIVSTEYLANATEKVILDHPSSTVWIVGDLNLPNVDWNNWPWIVNANNYSIACDLFVSHGFDQLVDSPTRDKYLTCLLQISHPLLQFER